MTCEKKYKWEWKEKYIHEKNRKKWGREWTKRKTFVWPCCLDSDICCTKYHNRGKVEASKFMSRVQCFWWDKRKQFNLKIELTSLKHVSEMESFVAVFLTFFLFACPFYLSLSPVLVPKTLYLFLPKKVNWMNPVSRDGEWHANQHLQNKQVAETLAEDSVLLLLGAVECICTKKHFSERNINQCWITESHSLGTPVLKSNWE